MAEFKIGDRVGVRPEYGPIGNAELAPEDMFGTICVKDAFGTGIDFDDDIDGHDCNGFARRKHGWYISAGYLFHETEISSIPAEAILEVLSNG